MPRVSMHVFRMWTSLCKYQHVRSKDTPEARCCAKCRGIPCEIWGQTMNFGDQNATFDVNYYFPVNQVGPRLFPLHIRFCLYFFALLCDTALYCFAMLCTYVLLACCPQQVFLHLPSARAATLSLPSPRACTALLLCTCHMPYGLSECAAFLPVHV